MQWPHDGIPVVDGHVHVNRFDLMAPGPKAVITQNPTFPLMERFMRDPAAFLEHMDREGVQQAWLINYCARAVMGYGREVNDWVASYVDADRTRLVAVGGYDPNEDGPGEPAIARLAALGIKALKIHPVHQHLRPDDLRLQEAFTACERRRMPVIVHTGTSRFPGADNAFADPAPLEAVCERHPGLPVIVAHSGRPDRTAAAIALARRHPNAWLDVSSCPPKRLPDYFGGLDQLAAWAPRMLWGSDWPGPGVPGMGANVTAFLGLGLPKAANQAVLRGNLSRLAAGIRAA